MSRFRETAAIAALFRGFKPESGRTREALRALVEDYFDALAAHDASRPPLAVEVKIGYVLFRDAIDFHMFKIINGEIRLLEAVITGYGYKSSGWEEK